MTAPRHAGLGIAFCLCFAGEVALNVWLIRMPPVWDAVGVFAPAVYLYESGFDLASLLTMPGYAAGGPNIHSLSLSTLLTVAAMWLGGGQPWLFLPGLHLVNFALAGLTGAYAFWLSRPLLGCPAAGLLAAALLLFPPFLVQSGALHTEMAGAALVMLAIASFVTRRFRWMALCVIAACAVKTLGLAVVAPLVLLVAADARIPGRRRAIGCGGIVLAASVIEAAKWVAAPSPVGAAKSLPAHLDVMLSHLGQVPDLAVLLGLALVACSDQTIRAARSGLQAALDNDERRTLLACALVPPACIGFVALVPLSGADFIPLQRYYLWALAPALIAIAATAQALGGRWVVTIGLAAFVAYAGVNRNGRFYPHEEDPIRRFSVVERSYEYLDYFQAQRHGVRGLASTNGDRPSFVTRVESYYLASPLMGWVDRAVPNVHFVLEPPYDSSHLSHFPNDFHVLELDSNPYHGQRVVLDLLAQAALRSDYELIVVAEWRSGPYTAKLIRIRNTTDGL